MPAFRMKRLGTIMEPEPGNPMEVEGVMNPAVIRGHDGELYLFPRLVAEGNFSRIGIARVIFDEEGDPVDVERIGVALEPEMDYELRPDGGGCEDARITFVEPLKYYMMTYTAFGPNGPRIAFARSKDLMNWERLGLATFTPYKDIEFEDVFNKDAVFFPIAIPNPTGHPQIAMLHRPIFQGTHPEETAHLAHIHERKIDLPRESIWISYCALNTDENEEEHLGRFTSHYRLASPVEYWETLKIGGGTPPILTRHGWFFIYHGVSETTEGKMCYSAGAIVLSTENPHQIKYRSRDPVLSPETPHERVGVVDDVVFPTGLDRRDDLGTLDRIDVYYGMADHRIGVAYLEIPEALPSEAKVDAPEAQS